MTTPANNVSSIGLRRRWYEAHRKWRRFMGRNYPSIYYLDGIADGYDDTIGRALRIAFDLFYLDAERDDDD